jgi:hypothetical protein
MNVEEIVSKIKELAAQHLAIDEDGLDELKDAEQIECEAEQLIIDYCVAQNYLINGFPTEKKTIAEDLDDDYFSRERYQLYLDSLLVEKEDVADLMWHYTSNFWPDYFESKEEYLETINHQIKCGVFYEVDLD